jgi:hypothetical protein
MKKTKLVSYIFLLIICLLSCKKELDLSNNSNSLKFSKDTIIFDTVFTTVGSPTQKLMIYNNSKSNLITNIRISGEDMNVYSMNVDGVSSNNIKNVEVPSNDSIFIFIEVRMNQNQQNNPLITNAQIEFNTNGKIQAVKLVAYGQDAYFHTANTYGELYDGEDTIRFWYHELDCNEVWNNDKPHVIYGYVIVDPGCQLIINEGTKVYLHSNSGILVGNPFSMIDGGTLKVNGQLGNEVIFQGDRLDSWYQDIPGQWDRIWLMPGSINNEFNYAIISEGTIGIHADTVVNNYPTAVINNCIIENMSSVGILGQGAKLEVNNSLVRECGQYTVACNIGGSYDFKHCTFVNFWSRNSRSTSSILLNNYYEDSQGNINIRDLEKASFTNCIIYGNLSNEIEFQENSNGIFNFSFDHSLITIDPKVNTNNINYINIIKNDNPLFVEDDNYNLSETSPCIDAGKDISLQKDILGNNRVNPDIGAYEFINY